MNRSVRNSAFNLGNQAVSVLAAFICIPIAFRQLGPERFGLLTLVWSMLSYAIAMDLGTGPAVARATAASLVHDNGARIAAIVRAGATIQLILGALAGILLFIFRAQLVHLIKVPAAFSADAQLAVAVLALAMPVALLAQSQMAVLEGLERFDLIAYIRSPGAAATYVLPAIGAVLGWSLAGITFAIFVSRLFVVGGLHTAYRKVRPPVQNGVMRAELPHLFRYGRWLAISGVLAQMLTYVDRFLLSALHGLNAVAQYSAPYDAAAKLLALPGSIGVALFPGMAKDAARNDHSSAVTQTRHSARVSMLILLPVCLVLFAFASPLLHAWLGPKLQPEAITAFRILLIATLFHAAAYPPVILIEAVGRSNIVAYYSLLELVVYLPVLVVAVLYFGVPGAAWAWTARTFALMLWSWWYARKI